MRGRDTTSCTTNLPSFINIFFGFVIIISNGKAIVIFSSSVRLETPFFKIISAVSYK